MSQSVAA